MNQLLSMSMDELMSLKVKISTNTDQTLSKAPSVISVITAEDIKATGTTNLTDLLQSIPGIYVRANLFGFRPIVTFRGASGNQTLLMVNGEPMSDLIWTSGIYWKGLPTTMIDRVEIIRGPGSALYGAGASAGVINVITKTAGKIQQAETGVRLGSFNTREGWVQDGGKWHGFDIGFTADLSHTDGHAPFIAKDRLYGTAASGSPGNAQYGWNGQNLDFSAARGSWRFIADYIGHTDLHTGLGGAGVLDPVTQAEDNRYNFALHYDNETYTPDWGLSAEVRYHHLRYDSGNGYYERPPGYTDSTGTYPDGQLNIQKVSEQGYNLEASGLYKGIRDHAVRLGGGFSDEDLYDVEQWVNFGTGPNGTTLPAGSPLVSLTNTPYAFAPEMSRRIGYLFLQDIWTLSDAWELTAGARYDHYSDFGSTVNPRLALVWQTTPRLTTKLMYGRAFRAPTYLELYSRTSATHPNANLQPERSSTVDLLLAYAASHSLQFSVDFYQFRQTNLIAADVTNTYQNSGSNRSRGIELEAQWQATPQLKITGNVSHRENQRNDTLDVYSTPNSKAYLRTDLALSPHWAWDVQANWIGERHLPPTSTQMPLDAYTLVDTTLRYFRRADWEFALSIRNLFNADARDATSSALPYNLPLPGRSFYTEIKYKF